jgi:hypothetical protein
MLLSYISDAPLFPQMAEVVAIRTFMKLKVLEKIPLEGSISLGDLAKATGAQESLLGDYIPPIFPYKTMPRR